MYVLSRSLVRLNKSHAGYASEYIGPWQYNACVDSKNMCEKSDGASIVDLVHRRMDSFLEDDHLEFSFCIE